MENLPESMYTYRQEFKSEPEPVRECDYCEKNIHAGDMIYIFDDGTIIHNHCLQDYASRYEETAE